MLKDKRLKALYDMTPPCGIAADIGADHGLLGCELIQTGKAPRVWFSDISADSLKKARELANKRGIEEKAEFFVGDGFKPFPFAPDTAIIAGMGGYTICSILEPYKRDLNKTTLVLGANTALYELRKWLCENAFTISDEAALEENGKYYVVIKSLSGRQSLSEDELHIGPVLISKTDANTKAYFAFRYKCALSAYENAKRSQSADLEALGKELKRWQTLL